MVGVTYTAEKTRYDGECKPNTTQKKRPKAGIRPRGIGCQGVGIGPQPERQNHAAAEEAPPELFLRL